jgi:uncharacterized membrane protein
LEKFILILLVNVAFATFFWWIHKKFNYGGTRGLLVAITLIFPFLGILYFVILTIQRVFRKKKANTEGVADKEFDEKNHHFENFKLAQQLLVSGRQNDIYFKNEKAKLKYLHFMMGAIDQLSRTISDPKRSELWFHLQSLAVGANLYSPDELERHLSNYGNPNSDMYEIGQKGWEAMNTYILSAVGKKSSEEFQISSLALSKILRN